MNKKIPSENSRPIFVLGDSRTGTLSMHNYFLANGLRSKHYFMTEALQTEPIHLNIEENERHFFEFLQKAEFDAYSDYPTRAFYQTLHREYPNAAFILTVRSSTERWLRSMRNFFKNFSINIDEESMQAAYEGSNQGIRALFGDGSRNFLELCIDDEDERKTALLADFLGISSPVMLSKDNSSNDLDNKILSKRYKFYSYQGERTPELVEFTSAPGKAIISEYGWTFLANDSNSFTQVLFGNERWSSQERGLASGVVLSRMNQLREMGAIYFKFIVPEKSVVYGEYLPRVLADIPRATDRPATLLSKDVPETVHYLESYLHDARSYGQLYFRGDTHPNWLGAWFIYIYIIERLRNIGLAKESETLTISDLVPSVGAYEGDLWSQLNPGLKAAYVERWRKTLPRYGFDLSIRFTIPEDKRLAWRVATPDYYEKWFERETFVYERRDGQGLKAVIFRDSTFDFCHELLAQHFSRSVFIWHQGQIYQEIIEREQPDVVLHGMAERFVTRYPHFSPFGTLLDLSSED